MTSQVRKPASQSLIGIKVFIIAISLAGTLFGWAVLAAGQIRDTFINRPAAVVQPSNTVPNTSPSLQPQSPDLRSVTGQFRPTARTRSSR